MSCWPCLVWHRSLKHYALVDGTRRRNPRVRFYGKPLTPACQSCGAGRVQLNSFFEVGIVVARIKYML